MSAENQLEKAKKQVEEEKGFYTHAIIYAAVISSFWIFNAYADSGHWWAIWPTLGWGIGLFFHGFGVFGKNAFFGKKWEERRIKQLMDKEE